MLLNKVYSSFNENFFYLYLYSIKSINGLNKNIMVNMEC